MKTKKLKKKLVFSKATVANLEDSQMNALKGGNHSQFTVDAYESCPCY